MKDAAPPSPSSVRWLLGRPAADAVQERVAARVAAWTGPRVPGLAVVLVGEDPPSLAYVRSKRKACRQVGIESVQINLPETASTGAVRSAVAELNRDPAVHGILVQLPLPPQVDAAQIIAAIDPAKDVDGLHPDSLGRLMSGRPGLVPCTPRGVMTLLDHYRIPVAGRRAVVLGRSALVGLPLALLLLHRDASVTVLHSKSPRPWEQTRDADIVVAAVGRPGLVEPEWIRPGATVVDVGITRSPAGLLGDVAPAVAEVAGELTPVPGGVGPMTVATLLANTVEAAGGTLDVGA
ncbi:MAG: bifunctional 5,10-methylenetetrahydrofolate dehydrogenase/5,10-methenyltetrahydrofolate cyclohydrolase [Thermaerobacter sp.]|nr:bifunctional 5,10-methylenetetrahydrofolate dehydrogenase/5,10-methenyltetrahydrofolate cyclohydrolase [Thermaerobacter sp.]